MASKVKSKSKKVSSGSEKKDQSRKDVLLCTARKLFAQYGLAGTSTRDISAQSKVNISMISYHFGGKEGLYRSVIEDFALKIASEIHPLLDSISEKQMTRESFIQDISRIIDHMIYARVSYPEVSTMFQREKLDGLYISSEISDRLFYPMVKKLTDVIDMAKKKKIVSEEVDPEIYFIALYEGIYGLYSFFKCQSHFAQKVHKKYEKNCEKIKKQILQIYLEGLLVRK